MIRDMRDSISSWPIRIILALLIISFVSLYIGGDGENLRTTEIAQVNGEPILAQDFSFRYNNIVQAYQRAGQFPGEIPDFLASMLQQQILSSLVFEKLKANEAEVLSLRSPSEEVKETIKKQFSGTDDKFDFALYKNILRNQLGKTPAQYEKSIREGLVSDQVEQFVMGTAVTSDLQVLSDYKVDATRVELSFVKIDPTKLAKLSPQPKPAGEEELQKFFNENQDTFKTKEKRKLKIAYVSKADVDFKDFAKEAEELLISNPENEKVRVLQTDYIDYESKVGAFSASEVTEILNATTGLEVSKNTILQSRDGNKVFSITLLDLTPESLPEFASIKNKVQAEYQSRQKEELSQKWITELWSEAKTQNTPLSAIAKKYSLNLETTKDFARAPGDLLPFIGEVPDGMAKAFALSPEKPYFDEPVKTKDGYTLVALKNKTEPDLQKFEEQKKDLMQTASTKTAQNRYTTWLNFLEKNAKIKKNLAMNRP